MATATLRSIRRRHIVLALALAALACLGLLTLRAVFARPGPPVDYASRANRLVADHQPAPADAPDGWDEWVALATDLNNAMFEERQRTGSPDLPVPTGVGWPIDFTTAGDPLAPAELRRNTEDFMARMAESGLDARIAAAAAAHPRAVRIIPSGGRLIDVVYSELGALRHVTNYEIARMRLAAAAGDWDAFAEAFDLAMRPAHILTHQAFVLDHMVGYAMHRSALAELEKHLDDAPDATLQRLANSLERAAPGPLWVAFRGEELRTLDILQHIHTDNGRGNGRLIVTEFKAIAGSDTGGFLDYLPMWKASNLVGAAFASKKESMAKAEEFYELAEAWVSRPPGQYDASMVDPTILYGNLGYKYVAMKTMVPAINAAMRIRNMTDTQYGQARIAVALERFRADNSAYPQTLDQLAPMYLEDVPPDPSTGTPFTYERTLPGRGGTAPAGYSLDPGKFELVAPKPTPTSPE